MMDDTSVLPEKVDTDALTNADSNVILSESSEDLKRKDLQEELAKTEEEIETLRQVLHSKEQHIAELKRALGITPLSQLKAELNKVQSSQAYKKTSETLKSAGHATATAINTFGTTVSNKFSEMKNSPTFKSFEEKVEGVGTTIMAKVTGTPREEDKEENVAHDESPEVPITKQPHAVDDTVYSG